MWTAIIYYLIKIPTGTPAQSQSSTSSESFNPIQARSNYFSKKYSFLRKFDIFLDFFADVSKINDVINFSMPIYIPYMVRSMCTKFYAKIIII